MAPFLMAAIKKGISQGQVYIYIEINPTDNDIDIFLFHQGSLKAPL